MLPIPTVVRESLHRHRTLIIRINRTLTSPNNYEATVQETTAATVSPYMPEKRHSLSLSLSYYAVRMVEARVVRV